MAVVASYGALWRARVDMMRVGNAAMAALGVLIGASIVVGSPFADPAAMLAAFFITAFGNVFNDISDRHIDATIHPERPLPSGRIALRSAQTFAAFLLGFGLLQAWIAGGAVLLTFAAANTLLLIAYDLRLKRWPLAGNVAVAALVASTFLFGAIPHHPWGTDVTWALWMVMAMVFLTNLARELLKDVEDASGDNDRRTLPMIMGAAGVGWLASIAVGAAVGIDAAVVWTMQQWSLLGRAILAGAAGAFLVAGGMGCYRAALGQRALKWAMLMALLGLLVAQWTPGATR